MRAHIEIGENIACASLCELADEAEHPPEENEDAQRYKEGRHLVAE